MPTTQTAQPDSPDATGRDNQSQARLEEITQWVNGNWEDLKAVPGTPGGWQRGKRAAVLWYEANYDNAPPGRLSFKDQVKLLEPYPSSPEETTDGESASPHPHNYAPASPQVRATWQAVLDELQLQLPRSAFQTWLKDTEAVHMDETHFVVSATTTFAVAWLERRMYNAIQKTVEKVTGEPLEVHFMVAQDSNRR